jgi:DNA-binding response OmpR family regulator
MCRALTVLCAAPGRVALGELKRAAVSASWELIGGASSADELLRQLDELGADVVVVDAGLPGVDVAEIRRVRPRTRVLAVGGLPGADAEVSGPSAVRDAILGVPPVGGPVGGPGRPG